MAITLKTNIKDWYEKAFPIDDLGAEINSRITFGDVVDCLNAGEDLYDCIGVGDSVIREHIFTQLAKILKVDYDKVYNKWLDADSYKDLVKESKVYGKRWTLMESGVDKASIKSKVMKVAKDAFAAGEEKDYVGTWYVDLGQFGKNRWAIAIAWMDWDNNDDWGLYAKVAYQPRNSIMQCDYDIDWEMPYDEETGEVFDTEIELSQSSLSSDVDYLLRDWEEIYNTIIEGIEESYGPEVKQFLTEGLSLEEAIQLSEDVITPETLHRVIQTPAYKKLLKDVEFYFNAVDDIRHYRDTVFRKAPINTLAGEADFCDATADFLRSIQLKGFSPELTKDFMRSAKDDAQHLNNYALRLRNILKKQDDSLYLRPDGKVNVDTNQKPGEYARRALRALQRFFEKLGLEFDYDVDYYKKNPAEFADLDKVIKRGGTVALPYEAKKWRGQLRFVVDEAVREGIYDKGILLGMGDDLALTNEQRDYFDKYIHYVID